MLNKEILQDTEYFLDKSESYLPDFSVAQVEIARLRAVIKYHNYCYHSLAEPIIADGQYDKLIALLHHFENNYPELIINDTPSQTVGEKTIDAFSKRTHIVPLLSLQNTYNAQDIRDRGEYLIRQHDAPIDSFFIEAKMDGSSVEIIYEFGELTSGITRGDGTVGEDISEHVRYLGNLPHSIAARKDIASVHLRAEVVMPVSAFKKVNNELAAQGARVFANSRNATAGTLRQLTPVLAEKRGLAIYCFECLYATAGYPDIETSAEMIDYFASVGVPIFPRNKTVESVDALVETCLDDAIRQETQEGAVGCDGLVIKVNNLKTRTLLGSTQQHPKRAIAYKYPTQEIEAHLEAISIQVGRSGVITPLAVIKPVALGGVTISKATLHNFDFIRDRDIRIGDRIWLKRSGEVIPYVIGPIQQRRDDAVTQYTTPTHCPICSTQLSSDDEQVAIVCPNKSCPGRVIAALQHFVSRACLDIVGLGDAIIEILVNAKIVEKITDIFLLTTQEKIVELNRLPGLGRKKITQIVSEITIATKKPLRRLIHGLGIVGVGKKAAQSVAAFIDTDCIMPYIDQFSTQPSDNSADFYEYLLKQTTQETLLTIYGIGSVTAQAIETYLQQESVIIQECIAVGLFDQREELLLGELNESDDVSTLFADQTVVVTGSLPVSRESLTQTLEILGATVSGSVSKNTTFLVAGENAGSKLTKAQSLNIPILNYETLISEHPLLDKILQKQLTLQETIDQNTPKKSVQKKTTNTDSPPSQVSLF